MNHRPARHQIKTVALYVLATVGGIAFAVWLADRLVVDYEMWSTGADSVAELSEDKGLGILMLLALGPAVLVGAGLGIGLAWLSLWSRKRWKTRQPASRGHAA